MNDLYLLEPEFRYHAGAPARSSSRSATASGVVASSGTGPKAATNEKNWIN